MVIVPQEEPVALPMLNAALGPFMAVTLVTVSAIVIVPQLDALLPCEDCITPPDPIPGAVYLPVAVTVPPVIRILPQFFPELAPMPASELEDVELAVTVPPVIVMLPISE